MKRTLLILSALAIILIGTYLIREVYFKGLVSDSNSHPEPAESGNFVTSLYAHIEDSTIKIGKSSDLKIFATFSDGTERDVTNECEIKIKDPEIISFYNKSVEGLSVGSTILEANYQDFSYFVPYRILSEIDYEKEMSKIEYRPVGGKSAEEASKAREGYFGCTFYPILSDGFVDGGCTSVQAIADRIASITIQGKIVNNELQFKFDNDGWNNHGNGKLVFSEDPVTKQRIITIDAIYEPSTDAMWGFSAVSLNLTPVQKQN